MAAKQGQSDDSENRLKRGAPISEKENQKCINQETGVEQATNKN